MTTYTFPVKANEKQKYEVFILNSHEKAIEVAFITTNTRGKEKGRLLSPIDDYKLKKKSRDLFEVVLLTNLESDGKIRIGTF